MGIPVVAGDFGGPYVPPDPARPPVIANVQGGSSTVFIKGASVALFPGPTITDQGTIITSTLNSTTTLIEGQSVILGGSVTNLSSGYSAGTLFAVTAIGVIVN